MKTLDIALRAGGPDYIELCQLLHVAGLAGSGGQGKHMVADGLVRIGGVVETRKAAKIRAGTEVVCQGLRIRVTAATGG